MRSYRSLYERSAYHRSGRPSRALTYLSKIHAIPWRTSKENINPSSTEYPHFISSRSRQSAEPCNPTGGQLYRVRSRGSSDRAVQYLLRQDRVPGYSREGGDSCETLERKVKTFTAAPQQSLESRHQARMVPVTSEEAYHRTIMCKEPITAQRLHFTRMLTSRLRCNSLSWSQSVSASCPSNLVYPNGKPASWILRNFY